MSVSAVKWVADLARAAEALRQERDEARADLQNLRDILLSQIPLTKEPGTNVELLRQLVQQRDSARAKAIQFDLDRAGIEQRAAEAAELVDLRAEVEREKASATRGWQTADELHLTVRDLKSEMARLRKALEKVSKWCHQGHGNFHVSSCGLCRSVFEALEEVGTKP